MIIFCNSVFQIVSHRRIESRKSIRSRTGVKTRETIPFIVHTARVFGIHRKIVREISFETEAEARMNRKIV